MIARDSSRRWRHRDVVARRGRCLRSGCWRSGRGWLCRSWCPAAETQTAGDDTSGWCQSRDELRGCTTCYRLARESDLSDLTAHDQLLLSPRANGTSNSAIAKRPRDASSNNSKMVQDRARGGSTLGAGGPPPPQNVGQAPPKYFGSNSKNTHC